MSLLLQTLLGRLTFSMYFWPYPGLLLLCMIASEVWDSETKSTEFVCSRAARKALNIVPEMSSALVRMSLPSSLASRSIYFKEMGCFTTSIWMLYLIRCCLLLPVVSLSTCLSCLCHLSLPCLLRCRVIVMARQPSPHRFSYPALSFTQHLGNTNR